MPTKPKTFATERGASSFAQRECLAINVAFATLKVIDHWVAVARLRSDQKWMAEDLQTRGLVTLDYTVNVGMQQKLLIGAIKHAKASR